MHWVVSKVRSFEYAKFISLILSIQNNNKVKQLWVETTVEKEENAGNEHFSLSENFFNTLKKQIHLSNSVFVNAALHFNNLYICHPVETNFNPFPNKPLFLLLCSASLLKTLRGGEIARNEQFLLFPQCFLPIWRTLYHFHQI